MTDTNDAFDAQDQKALRSIKTSRIIIPILLGLGVVFFLLIRRFDYQEFLQINWRARTFIWIGICVLLIVVRHLSYASRLKILSEGGFSWKKCIELIFIWEFSSAVSPTSVGGSAVAFFVLAQEKLSTAKTATIVLYTIVLDSFFFLFSLPFLYLLFGIDMIRPNAGSFSEIGGWGYYFVFAYCLMASYSLIFFFGLFIQPRRMQQFLTSIGRIKWLARYKNNLEKLGNDMVIASSQLKQQTFTFHFKAFLATASAWSCRFLLLNCLIIAFIEGLPVDFWTQFQLFARLESMFVIIAFSPTPGGAGFVEILFGGFLVDYVTSETYATVISTLWRLLSYYSYLIAGAIIIPNWIKNRINDRRNA